MEKNRTLLTTTEVAEMLHVKSGTLQNARGEKSTSTIKIPFVKVGSKVLYMLQDVEDYIERTFLNTKQYKNEVRNAK